MDRLERLNIEVTSVCNYFCTGCPNAENTLIRGKKHMKPELFKAVFDEVGDSLETIFLWNYGDPLLHPRIPDLLDYAGGFKAKKNTEHHRIRSH